MELHFNKGLAGAPAEAIAAARNTATNPAMLDAFALAIIAEEQIVRFQEFRDKSLITTGHAAMLRKCMPR